MSEKLKISGEAVREMARSKGITIEDLARKLDMNSQTFYRKKPDEKFGPKSTRKLLEFFDGLTTKAAG